MNIFKLWMRAATPGEQTLLAKALGSSREYLYQLSGGYTRASASRAGEIERETLKMHDASNGRLPVIYRTDMAEACRNCEYAQKCLGPLAIRSEFKIVTEESKND